jgi:hypothetical protein
MFRPCGSEKCDVRAAEGERQTPRLLAEAVQQPRDVSLALFSGEMLKDDN